MISGVLKKDVTLNGITYKVGETISVPVQYGLDDYFEQPMAEKKSNEKWRNIKNDSQQADR